MTKQAITLENARKLVAMFGERTEVQSDFARTITEAVMETYGGHPTPEMRAHAEQASLATILVFKPLVDAIQPFIEESERLIREYGGDRPDHQYQPLLIEMGEIKRLLEVYRNQPGTQTTDTES